jgi:phosphate transport system substrate-binding protein
MKQLLKIGFTGITIGTLGFGLSACNQSGETDNNQNGSSETQKVKELKGAGSSFVYPVMEKWLKAYYQKTNVKVNYQPIGSGGGQRQIFNRVVDFAGSDQPLKSAKLKKHDLIQFPIIIGGIVPTVNLPSIKPNEITLNGKILADIYLGKINYWDNQALETLNPKVNLPHKQIISIHRADGSGTTYNFASYLAKVSDQWKNQVGIDTTIDWPSGGIGAKGNAGVASQVQHTPYSIGYVEYAFAKENDMTTTKMQNKSGHTVRPSLKSFQKAAANADWKPKDNFYTLLTNAKGKQSWPINASTYILLPKDNKRATNKAIMQFLSFGYSKQGAKLAQKLEYVDLPRNVVQQIKKYWLKKLDYTIND